MRCLLLALASCTTAVGQPIPDSNFCTVTEFSSAGVQACVDAVDNGVVGGTVFLPAGMYWFTEPVHITKSYTSIVGTSRGGTLIQHNSGGGVPFFHFDNVAASSLERVYLYSGGGRLNTGILADDVEEFRVDNVRMDIRAGIGMVINGRDSISVQEVTIHADEPLKLGPASGYFDQTNFHNTYLIEYGLDHPIVYISPEAGVMELSFSGFQSWVGGSYGLYWSQSEKQIGKSSSIHIQNMRREQAGSNHSIHIDRSPYNHLDRFICTNCTFAYHAPGVYLRGVYYPSITLSTYDGIGRAFDIANYRDISLDMNVVREESEL